MPQHVTYNYRIRDCNARKHLKKMAASVNRIWNFCVSTTQDAKKHNKRWPTGFDLNNLTAGSGRMLADESEYYENLLSNSVQEVCRQFASSRNQHRKIPKFRHSKGRKRSLGWVPFKCANDIKIDQNLGTIKYYGRTYKLWFSRKLIGEICNGRFVEDNKGNWHVQLVLEIPDELFPQGRFEDCGVDPGVHTLMTIGSDRGQDGQPIITKVDAPLPYMKMEAQIQKFQRFKKKKKVKKLHRKAKYQRRHFLHVVSKKMTELFRTIYFGNLSVQWLIAGNSTKKVLDSALGELRRMISYKSAMRRGSFILVNEAMSTQICSNVACRHVGGPKGVKDLGVRWWVCDSCGTHHDRDGNAAVNILLSGRSIDRQVTGVLS